MVGGLWSAPELVPLFADSSISVGHPAISNDELSLYFVAETDKGEGGKDIWKVERSSPGSIWGKPINLGKQINTEGDEMFPYVRDNGEFYFSSNGHVGLGGLDIFKLTQKDRWNYIVENMKLPINSPADDIRNYLSNQEKTEVIMSSTRPGGTRNMTDIYYR